MKKIVKNILITVIVILVGIVSIGIGYLFGNIDDISLDIELFTIGLFSISIIVFVISMIISYKKNSRRVRRELEGVLSPILAEMVIDKGNSLRKFIMTAIIELSVRGNLKIVDNTAIELVHINNLEEFELEIINLLFSNNRQVVKFEEINRIFAKSKEDLIYFSSKYRRVKYQIKIKLKDMGIISVKKTILSKILKTISVLNIVNLILLILINKFEDRLINIILYVFFMDISVIVYYIQELFTDRKLKDLIIGSYNDEDISDLKKIILIMIGLCILSVIILISDGSIITKILIVGTCIINILSIYFNEEFVLTKKGEEERIKLLEIKNYLNQYSLMKERDLAETIIWDNYMAYAVIFGISSKVISKIYEGWYIFSRNIQFLQSMLKK